MSPNKEVRQLLRKAKKQGWDVSKRKSNHLLLESPDGATVMVPCSPSDWRSMKNCEAELKRAGMQL